MSVGQPSVSEPRSSRFSADVSMAAHALVNQPPVALVTIFLWSFPAFTTTHQSGSTRANPFLFVASSATILFLFGWVGAERIFFLRQFEGKPVTLKHLISLVPAFMGRFVVLALVVGAAFVPFALVLGILFRGSLGKGQHSSQFGIATTVFVVAMDLALTFVPAALAITTRSVTRALRIGLAMIRETWPRSALYVLCPVLALNLNRLVYPADLPALRVIAAAGLAVVALLAKGATVAFYLRQRPVDNENGDEDGAAHLQNG